MALSATFEAHLRSGSTTVCRCWKIRRRDGTTLGFTDHDRDLAFDGTVFRADTGLTARTLEQTSGLSVDNSEALGALSAASITEEDIRAGRFDAAEIVAWLVNWVDPDQRHVIFRGTLGEVSWSGSAFTAELRGLGEALNQPQGQAYLRRCQAVLGDQSCGFDTMTPGFFAETEVGEVEDGRTFRFGPLTAFADRWFERGKLEILSGRAEGLSAAIKNDRVEDTSRVVELWESIRAQIATGDTVRLTAGCDKSSETCRLKFDNFLNFRGFPDIPGEDWLMVPPSRARSTTGGSRRG